MLQRFIFPILVLSILFSACHKKAILSTNAAVHVNKTSSAASSEIKNIIIDSKLDGANIGGASFNVDSLAIAGDVLSIFVNYSGGCKEHTFELYSNKMYAKSLPPQLILYLKHINNEDGCRRLITQELKFNISAVKYTNSLILKVANKSIKYQPK